MLWNSFVYFAHTHTKMRMIYKLLTDRRLFLKTDKDSQPQNTGQTLITTIIVWLGTHCCWRAIRWGLSLWWEAPPNLSGRSPWPALLCTLAPSSASSLQRVLSFHWASFWISCKTGEERHVKMRHRVEQRWSAFFSLSVAVPNAQVVFKHLKMTYGVNTTIF